MSDVMGLIYTGEMDTRLRELTAMRAIAALPILSRYRLIDFPLSNMVNSGIRNIGIIMQRNYRSLLDHLGSGKEWDLHGKRAGLTILPPFLTKDSVGVYEGFLDALHSNLPYLRSMKEKYIVLTNSFMLYHADFEDMVEEHEKSGADITLMYTKDKGVRRSSQGKYCEVQEDGRVTQIEVDPMISRFDNTMLEVFCLRRELLISLIDLSTSRGHYHFTRQMLQTGVNDKSLNVHGYECKSRVWAIDSVEAYYQCSMELLDPDARASLFPNNEPILTKLRDEMPSRYLPGAKVSNSLIADGCVIEGTVENCILFRSVRIGKDASIRNSIVMQDGRIGPLAEVNHVIMDKQSAVRESTRLIGAANYPVLVSKNLTV
ncbi:MAG: glucose-1-phosphate adenylyltransferase subunit GlgD [Clostridia bacterium]|nr:glucose-1-phosphate adenylyltransferase subunit GlgD [Clostridia bacterium]